MVSIRTGWKCFLMLAILLLAGCNLAAITPVPTPAPTATFVPAPIQNTDPLATAVPQNPNCAATPLGWIPYRVESGDSLGLLASQTDSTVPELAAGNCLENGDQIEVDAIIYLPRPPVIG